MTSLKYCPKCKKTFESEERFCPEDGAQLQEHRRPGDPMIGRLVAGKYRILDRLGVGGFGSVYRCEDLRFESICAIKILDQHRLEELKAVNAGERFIREARLLKKLSDRSRHADTLKYIVQALDVDEDHEEGLLYFTMDFVEGRHLLDVLQDKGRPLSVDRVVRIARQTCKALNLAHPEIVHRDIKPENLMLTEVETGEGIEEIVKILDFGIAKVEGDKRLTQGPAAAMAPEQVQRRADYRADLFSLGVILYELLTFRSPWTGRKVSDPPDEDWFGLIEKSRTVDPTPITEYNEAVPKELEQIIHKLLVKDPERRYQSALDLDGALARVEELLEQSRPGSIRVLAGTDGVAVVLRHGRKRLHASKTPATFKRIDPGRYHVAVEDKRFKRESGVVEVHPGAQSTVQLRASPRPKRTPLSVHYKRYKKPIHLAGAASVLVILGLSIFQALRPPPWMTDATFAELIGQDAIRSLQVRPGALWIELSEPVDGSDEHRVRTAGVALQSLTRRFRDAGLEIEGRGDGEVRVSTRAGDERQMVSDLPVSIESLCDECSSPAQGPAGWYAITFSQEEWDLDSTRVEDADGVFLAETVGGLSPSFFLPGDHSLEVGLWLTQTELGVLVGQIEEALAAGRLDEGEDPSAVSLVGDLGTRFPDSKARRRLTDQVANGYLTRARAAGSEADAERIVGDCLSFAPGFAPCSSLIDSIQTAARLAAGATRAAEEAARAAEEAARAQDEPVDSRVVDDSPQGADPVISPQERTRPPTPTQPPVEERREAEPEARDPDPVTQDPAPKVTQQPRDTATFTPPVEEEEEEPAPLPPPSVSRIGIGSWSVAEQGSAGLRMNLQIAIQNAPARQWCAAVRVLDEDGNPIEDRNGEFQVGGRVAVASDFRPSNGFQELALALPLPDGLDRSVRAMIGQTRLQIQGTIWPNSCSAVGSAPPQAESAPTDVCFIMSGNQSFRPCR
jgi:serine/threonine protein kinase